MAEQRRGAESLCMAAYLQSLLMRRQGLAGLSWSRLAGEADEHVLVLLGWHSSPCFAGSRL